MFKTDFHVAISIVTWNSKKYLGNFLRSLDGQTFKDFQIILVDNASSDGTLDAIKDRGDVIVIKNSANLGFSRAHNKGIEMAMKCWEGKDLNERFIFIANPDVELEPDCLEKLLLSICRDKNLGAIAPKLLRLIEEQKDGLSAFNRTDIVDSLGIDIYKSRKIVDRASGEKDKSGQSAELADVFGLSGAFMCVRAEALIDIKSGKEYFDEDFFAYKEDADLAWRLRNMGWRLAVDYSTRVFHARGAKSAGKEGFWHELKNQKSKPKLIKFWSARNHFWIILKNDYWRNILADLPFFLSREAAKFFYCLLFDRSYIGAYGSALTGIPKMLSKRRYLKNAKTTPSDIRALIK